ncbi:MAG: hypothetical protein JSS32_08105 [Verrucomicrobia bacterium]|nr:hypothetical protein [Verrucomicrobiota bacterium]
MTINTDHTAHAATAAVHSAKTTSHKDASFLNNWINSFMALVNNILSNYELQSAEDKVLSKIGSLLQYLGNTMNSDLSNAAAIVQKNIGNDYLPYWEENYSNVQTADQQKMQAPQRQLDQFNQLTKDNSSSTDTAFQMIQTIQTIPQNTNSK